MSIIVLKLILCLEVHFQSIFFYYFIQNVLNLSGKQILIWNFLHGKTTSESNKMLTKVPKIETTAPERNSSQRTWNVCRVDAAKKW